MNHPSLWKISVTISPEAEEAVTHLLGEVLGQTASVYLDARRGTTVARSAPRCGRGCAESARAV